MIKFNPTRMHIYNVKDFNLNNSSPLEILTEIGEPFCVFVPGKDTKRNRLVSTLIHGNEPSGYFAFLNWLKLKLTPATNTYFMVSGVGAALTKPYFTQRVMISGIDLNRSFYPPYNSYEGKLAKELLQLIELLKPEAIIDIHNTSGHSPDFAICVEPTKINLNISSMFTTKCLVINMQMGTMVEIASLKWNCAVIECGNANHPLANQIALRGLETFLKQNNLEKYAPKDKISMLHDPVRLELKLGKKVLYSSEHDVAADIVMKPDVDKLNSEKLEVGCPIAKITDGSFDIFNFANEHGNADITEYFYIENKTLYAKIPIHLFMVTTNPVIAQNDCLFYVVKD
jgi:hypothetical protein